MEKSETNSRPKFSRARAVLELDDQTKRAANLEIARRLELVRAETNTYRKTRRGVATTTTAATPGSASVFKPLSTAGAASDYDGVSRALSR
jgi:hypothetical protein